MADTPRQILEKIARQLCENNRENPDSLAFFGVPSQMEGGRGHYVFPAEEARPAWFWRIPEARQIADVTGLIDYQVQIDVSDVPRFELVKSNG
jgi:hypothetical protein